MLVTHGFKPTRENIMKYGLIATFILFLLDRYELENMNWLEILAPLILVSIVEIVTFYFWLINKLDEKSRELKKDIIHEKWRREKLLKVKERHEELKRRNQE